MASVDGELGAWLEAEQAQDASISLARIDVRHDDEERRLTSIGDPELRSVENVVITFLFGPRLQGEGI